jgi:hypothetical protein
MEFSFEVNPDLDIAIGTELSIDESEFDPECLTDDFDYSNLDPLSPTGAKPGSEDKVRMLAARYAAGVPLWHEDDCYDHGPTDTLDNFSLDNNRDYDLDDDF